MSHGDERFRRKPFFFYEKFSDFLPFFGKTGWRDRKFCAMIYPSMSFIAKGEETDTDVPDLFPFVRPCKKHRMKGGKSEHESTEE